VNTIELIIAKERLNDPQGADYYTEDWVRRACTDLNCTPEQYLAKLERIDTERAARAGQPPDPPDPKWEKMRREDPERYLMALEKTGGPMDGYSAELMGYYAFWELPDAEQHQLQLDLIGARGHDALVAAYQKAQALGFKGPAVYDAKSHLEENA